jgi:protein involved in temperature-dependent protein secretion
MDEQNLNDKLIFADRALRFAPVSYVAYHSALLLAVAGDGKAARNRFQQAARVYPQDLPEIRAELSKLAARRPDVFAPLLGLADAGPRESRQ